MPDFSLAVAEISRRGRKKNSPEIQVTKIGLRKTQNEGPLEAQARDPCQLELCSSTRDLGTPAPFAMFVFIIGMIFRPYIWFPPAAR